MAKHISDATYAHASFVVSELDAAVRFLKSALAYQLTFGPVEIGGEMARLTSSLVAPCHLVQLTRAGSGTIELIEGNASSAAGPSPHLSFEVEDLTAAIAAAERNGAAPMGQVTQFSEGRAVYMRAPGGLVIELEELT